MGWLLFIVFHSSFSSFSPLLFCHLIVSGGCRVGVCPNIISHGVSKRYIGKSAAQCTEKPALPPAGPCQHVERASRRDPQITTAMHRWAWLQVAASTSLLFMLLWKIKQMLKGCLMRTYNSKQRIVSITFFMCWVYNNGRWTKMLWIKPFRENITTFRKCT